MRLDDGTVVPSYLSATSDAASNTGDWGFFSEVSIMAGEITAVFPPDHPSNTNGKLVEYSVNVWRRSYNSLQERLAFRCLQSDSFGSIADLCRFSMRSSVNTPGGSPLGNGATVFIACINGDRSNAYIIGAMPQPNRKDKDPSESRWMNSRFNGVTMDIHDDGSLEIMVPGATTTTGQPDPNRDNHNHGSKLTFAANGDITLDDQTGNKVMISPINNSVEVTGNTVGVTANTVNVVSNDINLGSASLNVAENGVVIGSAIDTFTGMTFAALQNTSLTVKASK